MVAKNILFCFLAEIWINSIANSMSKIYPSKWWIVFEYETISGLILELICSFHVMAPLTPWMITAAKRKPPNFLWNPLTLTSSRVKIAMAPLMRVTTMTALMAMACTQLAHLYCLNAWLHNPTMARESHTMVMLSPCRLTSLSLSSPYAFRESLSYANILSISIYANFIILVYKMLFINQVEPTNLVLN